MINKPFYETIAEKIIVQLQSGTAPWLVPFNPGIPNSKMPFNPLSGKRYRGINVLNLLSEQYDDLRWMTYKQALEVGGQVKKGEKGTVIQYWKFYEEALRLDENNRPILDKEGIPIKEIIQFERPKVFYATVFNAEQMEGLKPYIPSTVGPGFDPNERAEKIINNSGASIFHNENNKAYYKPSTDSIHLPSKEQFHSVENYYATVLHELGHWTGHESRLDRDLKHPFGSESYAREELRAEIASMILGDELGIGHNTNQHTAYIKSWINVLKDDPLEIFRAAADAEKIQDYVLGFELKHTQEITIEPQNTFTNKISKNIETNTNDIVWLDIPFHQKDTAKQVAGLLPNGKSAIAWSKEKSSWYAMPGADLNKLNAWLITKESNVKLSMKVEERTWLVVPFSQKETLKKIAGKLSDGRNAVEWDKEKKCWFAHPGADLNKLNPWLVNNSHARQAPALSPREEFSLVLQNLGCIVNGEHPIMDGQKHRIKVDSDKNSENSGFYVGYLDGHPAGYVKNNRTGIEVKWKSKGYSLTEEQKATLQAEVIIKQEERERQQLLAQEQTAKRVASKIDKLIPITKATPYLINKGIEPTEGIFTDKEGLTTFIPVVDINNKQWSMQYIQEDGTKRFAKDSRKEGCFHVVGGMKALESVPILVIGEGYATCNTVSKVLGFATISAFDSGNLIAVAKALHERYPDKPKLFIGDDDLHLERTKKVNPGKSKAIEAATLVGGKAIFPIFAPNEQSINPKEFSDFNDLATKSTLGIEGVSRQIKCITSEMHVKNMGLKNLIKKSIKSIISL